MLILSEKKSFKEIIEADGIDYFPDDKMIKAVADLDKRIIAVNAALHSDLEEYLLDSGSEQSSISFPS